MITSQGSLVQIEGKKNRATRLKSIVWMFGGEHVVRDNTSHEFLCLRYRLVARSSVYVEVKEEVALSGLRSSKVLTKLRIYKATLI